MFVFFFFLFSFFFQAEDGIRDLVRSRGLGDVYKRQQSILLCILFVASVSAGNPDRQGEAGAYELLMNPWARSSGLNLSLIHI